MLAQHTTMPGTHSKHAVQQKQYLVWLVKRTGHISAYPSAPELSLQRIGTDKTATGTQKKTITAKKTRHLNYIMTLGIFNSMHPRYQHLGERLAM